MKETRHFLRYITPGVLFGFLTISLVGIALTDWTSSVLMKWVFTEKNSLAFIITTLLISGVLGYLFATIHHFCHWYLPTDKNVINHTEQVNSLREKGLIPSSWLRVWLERG